MEGAAAGFINIADLLNDHVEGCPLFILPVIVVQVNGRTDSLLTGQNRQSIQMNAVVFQNRLDPDRNTGAHHLLKGVFDIIDKMIVLHGKSS